VYGGGYCGGFGCDSVIGFASRPPLPAIELLQLLVNRQAIDSELWFTPDVKKVRPALRELTKLVEEALEDFEAELKANEMLVIERDELLDHLK